MDLAIVIPYFKKKFFKSCLDSLACQTNKNFRVYIGNDGSLENPEDLIKSYLEKLNIEYHYFAENLGSKSLVAHWNRCLEKTSEERWIIILGDDDVLGENCVESFYASLKTINALDISVVRFATQKINADNEIVSNTFYHPEVEKSLDFLFRRLKGETRSSLSEYIIRKDRLEDKGLKDFPLAWHTDDLLILESSEFGNVYTINNSKVFFRLSGLNISSLQNNLIIKNKASFLFYSYLLENYSRRLKEEQKNTIYLKVLGCYDNNKSNLSMFQQICLLTIRYNKYWIFLHFWKRVVRFKIRN